ncbi:LSU ribosomal protein L18P [Desulfocicer vacuolatum DSM 3385]|uniref:Large ribosomal subunit protein uL18 n=1 Tax=Desulfocicer vacuolatum DSM 3385 TaxID=1121400 RepID=A0A1W1YI43_9BACT|nr:50S ribosomal protein L18 [Desulfocicer vacuolatum]SMC35839.1 LSU ribosomal protein L18P [Desulfocicer vacuolatum DSM 3385]
MANRTTKRISRLKRKRRIRKNINGTSGRPRLSVFRSASHIYAQIIDDVKGHTIVSASTLDAQFKETGIKGSGKEGAVAVGKLVGQRALDKGVTKVTFDRNGFLYHGRVKSVSDGAREAGLNF